MKAPDLSPLDRLPGASEALAQVWSILPQARLVGGVVRDLIAGRDISDIDLATPEPPDTVMRRLSEASVRAIATGLSHGTVTALVRGRTIEITTLRRDCQTDGRHAVVAWTEDWREDAQRRDFTINAMSLSRERTLYDYFGGADDLAAGRVRFVGDPARRIAEDALRILRFFRFDARYGLGEADAPALGAIGAAVAALEGLSAERVWSELRRILVGPEAGRAIGAMHRLGVLDRLLPGGTTPQRLVRLLTEAPSPDPVLRLAALIDGPAVAVARALRLSNTEADRLQALLETPVPRSDMDDAALRRLLADEPAELLCGRSWLAGGDGTLLRQRLSAMPRPVFPLAGRDVLASGVPPGPEVGRLLALARAWWRDGGCSADRAACLAYLHSRSRPPS